MEITKLSDTRYRAECVSFVADYELGTEGEILEFAFTVRDNTSHRGCGGAAFIRALTEIVEAAL